MRKLPITLILVLCQFAPAAQALDQIFASRFDEPVEGPYSASQAARFLTQGTYGPTLLSIDQLQSLGYNAWLTQQFSAPITRHQPYVESFSPSIQFTDGDGLRLESWWQVSKTAPDQLRQRVAFALSQILVVSTRGGNIANTEVNLANYYDVLVEESFGNYRNLLERVSKHAAMGKYLSHLGNQKEDTALNIRPDENYARELMQLFSIGLVMLNADGTVQLNAQNQPIPTYNQNTIRGFARVLTGWNFSSCSATTWFFCSPSDNNGAPWRTPMVGINEFHEPGSKQLTIYPGVSLAGGLLPGGGTPQQDLSAAIDNLFNHPNVGPFLAQRLIQRLIKSDPTPAYVGRVAAVFANNGASVRGDMKAVVRAVLMDPEARGVAGVSGGKLREPMLRTAGMFRALDAFTPSNRLASEAYPETYSAQAPLRSPSVFNFYLPNYAIPASAPGQLLLAPEFQIASDNQLIGTSNHVAAYTFWQFAGNDANLGDRDIRVRFDPLIAIADNPRALLERLDLLFVQGRMSEQTYQALIPHLSAITAASNGSNYLRSRVQDALYFVLNSPEYLVEE
jgi:uncharacterized protein (DUF1800 family)